MVGYNGFDVCHVAIAKFKRVPVEHFVSINEREEELSYICFDVFAEGGLYQIMFLARFFREWCISWRGFEICQRKELYFNVNSYSTEAVSEDIVN